MTTLVRVLKEAEEQAERPHPSISLLHSGSTIPFKYWLPDAHMLEKQNLEINSKTVKQLAEGSQDEDPC